MKYEITINKGSSFSVEKGYSEASDKVEQILLNDQPAEWSCHELEPGRFSVLYQHKSYICELLKIDRERKTVVLKTNGQKMRMKISEPMDHLLENMGLDVQSSHAVNQITSPMPGMVLKVNVKEGQKIEKGDPVLILEAMKMENVFKAPGAATVKEVRVKENEVVEKGAVLVVLE